MLQAADFAQELLNAHLLYLTGASEVRVVVLENQAYRFMLMGDAVQSVMNRADPQAIEFAHQQLMLRDLARLKAGARVLELGLGGGCAVRHARLQGYPLRWTSVEHNSEVVNLFWDYFDVVPEQEVQGFSHVIELADSIDYLKQLPQSQQFELILCDVYDELGNELIHQCIRHVHPEGELVINWLPHMQSQGAQSTDFFQQLVQQHGLQHKVESAAGFANQIHRLSFVGTK